MSVSAVPGVFETAGVRTAHWRDALRVLQPVALTARQKTLARAPVQSAT